MKKIAGILTLVAMIVTGSGVTAPVLVTAQNDDRACVDQVIAIQAAEGDLVERYRPLRVVDAHQEEEARCRQVGDQPG